MLAKLLSKIKEQHDKLGQYLSQKNPDKMKRRIAALPLREASASMKGQPLIPEEDLHLPSAEDVLKYSTVFDTSFLEAVQDVYQDSQQITDHLDKRRPVLEELKKCNLTDCPPLDDEQQNQPPPPGYVPAGVNLENRPASLKVEHLYFVKLAICDVLQVQPYAVILRGFRHGSTVVDVFVAEALEIEVHDKASSIATFLHDSSDKKSIVSLHLCSCRLTLTHCFLHVYILH